MDALTLAQQVLDVARQSGLSYDRQREAMILAGDLLRDADTAAAEHRLATRDDAAVVVNLRPVVDRIARIIAASGRNPHAQLGSVRQALESVGLAADPPTERRRADDPA